MLVEEQSRAKQKSRVEKTEEQWREEGRDYNRLRWHTSSQTADSRQQTADSTQWTVVSRRHAADRWQ
jgi:hypothetical protein